MRARDALTYLKNTPNQFNTVDYIQHVKEIGTNPETPVEEKVQLKKKKKTVTVDDDGFTTIKTNK